MRKIALVMLVFMAGCESGPSTMRFEGPGDFNAFLNARYQCARETTVRFSSGVAVGSASVNSVSGTGSSTASSSSAELPSCSMLDACLAAKGYFRNPNGRLDASSVGIRCMP